MTKIHPFRKLFAGGDQTALFSDLSTAGELYGSQDTKNKKKSGDSNFYCLKF